MNELPSGPGGDRGGTAHSEAQGAIWRDRKGVAAPDDATAGIARKPNEEAQTLPERREPQSRWAPSMELMVDDGVEHQSHQDHHAED
jgi:hypothetical protein